MTAPASKPPNRISAGELARARLAAKWTRLTNHEWWPLWVYYAPLLLAAPFFARKKGGLLAFTACDPGIENGGGFSGESKSRIMARLPQQDPRILRTQLLKASDPRRADQALRLATTDPSFAGLPVVLKPETGQNGKRVTLAHTEQDIRAYFAQNHDDVVMQRFSRFHGECGIFWIRKTHAQDPRPIHQRDGFIYSITLKEFQYLIGDGHNTIRQLIWRHPRYRCQARTFLTRFHDRLDHVLAQGERLLLSFAGNHVQGAKFLDGSYLITPALEAAINDIARSFQDDGFDYGRFDLRYRDQHELAKGRGFEILEVNGTTSESINMYDPTRSQLWAWRVLLGHWRHAYRIGHERIAQGGKPLTLRQLLRLKRT